MGLSFKAIGDSLLIEGYAPRRGQVWHGKVRGILAREAEAAA